MTPLDGRSGVHLLTPSASRATRGTSGHYASPVAYDPDTEKALDEGREAVAAEQRAAAEHKRLLDARNRRVRHAFQLVDQALPEGPIPHTQIAARLGLGASTFRSLTRDLNDARSARLAGGDTPQD